MSKSAADSARAAFTLPRIKVCGLKRIEDARAALAAGADALGAVHYVPSPRSAELEEARAIFALDPSACGVLVVVDPGFQQAQEWMELTGARAIQLCGSQKAAQWAEFPSPILRRLPVDSTADAEIAQWSSIATAFVLDHPATAGGSGLTVDFALAQRLADRVPCLLAGGLDAENVQAAIQSVQPAGVDASSRLELLPGCKNAAAVLAFARAAQHTFASLSLHDHGTN